MSKFGVAEWKNKPKFTSIVDKKWLAMNFGFQNLASSTQPRHNSFCEEIVWSIYVFMELATTSLKQFLELENCNIVTGHAKIISQV